MTVAYNTPQQQYLPRVTQVEDGRFFSKYSGNETDAVRFEVSSNSLGIGKIRFHFQKLKGVNGGMKEVGVVDIFLDKGEALTLSNAIISDKMLPNEYGVYYQTSPMGTSATDLAARQKSRPSGASEFRQMRIQRSNSDKYFCFINAMACDALMTKKGLFVPQTDQNKRPVNAMNIGIPLTLGEIKNLASLVVSEVTAYKTAQWLVNVLTQSGMEMSGGVSPVRQNTQPQYQQAATQRPQPQTAYQQPQRQVQYQQVPVQNTPAPDDYYDIPDVDIVDIPDDIPDVAQPQTSAQAQPAQNRPVQYQQPTQQNAGYNQPVSPAPAPTSVSNDDDWGGGLDIDTSDLPF